MLLLHRCKPPNADLYSPIGGKLEQAVGESPTACAIREIHEETGLVVDAADLHLTGLVSEAAYEHQTHWLMFLYEVIRPVQLQATTFDEGTLEWHEPNRIDSLSIPDSDRQIIWPLFWKHRGGFFAAHLDCTGDQLTWTLEQAHTPPPLIKPPPHQAPPHQHPPHPPHPHQHPAPV